MISITNLHKTFGSVTAVHDVSFQAENGQITGLLGPNGAGKTTTLRVLSTLVEPTGGHVSIDGINVLTHPVEVRSRIGILPDTRGLYPRLTARENILYYGELFGMSGKKLHQRVDELIQVLDFAHVADRRTQGFSQGERMKVAIARCLVHNPPNVLLDEPTNGLDVKSARALRTFVKKLRQDGVCVIFSSHIMQEVADLCDKIVVVAKGKVRAHGTPDELLQLTGKTSLEEAFVALSDEGETTP
ncbi:MAG: ATP-binding cassette domain-containing protein [Polyangiaceae bacterium]|nr:ATP-binding cassette domain-containing protein [Polyangiaceae bacterium]